jgi:RNA polymerase sigma factor (sigma-70 family)
MYIQTKEEKYREVAIESTYGMIFKMVARDKVLRSHFEDAVNAGVIGVCIALEKFDPSKNLQLSTYAYWFVLQQFQILKQSLSIITVPIGLDDPSKPTSEENKKYLKTLRVIASLDYNMPSKDIYRRDNLKTSVESYLMSPTPSVLDMMQSAEKQTEDQQLIQNIKQVAKKILSDRLYNFFEMKYFYSDDILASEELAEILGLTKASASSINYKITKILHRSEEFRKLVSCRIKLKAPVYKVPYSEENKKEYLKERGRIRYQKNKEKYQAQMREYSRLYYQRKRERKRDMKKIEPVELVVEPQNIEKSDLKNPCK